MNFKVIGKKDKPKLSLSTNFGSILKITKYSHRFLVSILGTILDLFSKFQIILCEFSVKF